MHEGLTSLDFIRASNDLEPHTLLPTRKIAELQS